MLNIYIKIEKNIKKTIWILFDKRKTKSKAIQDLFKSLLKLNRDQIKSKLTANFFICTHNFYKQNALIIICYKLLYFDFGNAYSKKYNRYIKKYIKLFAILFQGSNCKISTTKIIYFIVYSKYISKKNFW